MTTKKIHRFIGAYQLGQGTMRLDDPDLAEQMRSVLRLTPGEIVIIGDGTGLEAQCRILGYDRGAVLVEGVAVGRNPNELQLRVTLYLAILKADHFESAAARATEAGVARIMPVLTGRTVKTGLRHDRVVRIVREAAELAGRGLVPEVAEPVTLQEAWNTAADNDANFFLDPSGGPLGAAPKSARTAGIFVGPEGGWDDAELAIAREAGMKIVSLGGLILRAETAAVVATYAVAHSLKS